VGRFVLSRLAAVVGVLFALSLAVFAIRAVLPADPIRAMVGGSAPAAVVERVRHELGYDQPLPVQYVTFLQKAATGDFGTSLRTRRPVLQDIAQFGPATLELAIWTGVLVLVMAIVLGTWAASERFGAGALRVLMNAFGSAPTFAVALFLLLLLYRQFQLFPPGARLSDGISPVGPTGLFVLDGLLQLNLNKSADALWHLFIPATCLAIIPAVAIARVLQGSLVTVMREDYIRTARSKGLSNGAVVRNHGLRNAAGPALSMAGLQFGALLTGVVIIEQMLAWPGIGRYASQAIGVADFPAITAVVLVLGVSYVLVNFIVDVLQIAADPRLRAREFSKS